MSLTIAMRAPNSSPQVTLVAKSGNSYTSDLNGLLLVQSGDIAAMENMGCTALIYTGLPLGGVGKFYGGNPQGATQAAVLTVLGTLYAYPIEIPSACTLKSLNLSVTTGQTGGKGRAALFYDNGAGYPGAIVPGSDSGDLDATGTAVVTKSGLSTILQPGWYWIVSIFTASTTMPSVVGTTATYASGLNAILGSDTAAHELAVSADAATGIAKTGQTYPVTDMTTSFPTFPAGAALTLNATTPVLAFGV